MMRNQTDIVRLTPSPSTLGECLVFNVQRSTLNVQRPIRKCAAALIACLLLVAGCRREQLSNPATQQPPRDVLLITIDTLRADSVGYAGNTHVKTPFLDSLAARGIVFANAHAHNVVTLPSHVNILTGLYPWQHGVRDNAGFLIEAAAVRLSVGLRAKVPGHSGERQCEDKRFHVSNAASRQ